MGALVGEVSGEASVEKGDCRRRMERSSEGLEEQGGGRRVRPFPLWGKGRGLGEARCRSEGGGDAELISSITSMSSDGSISSTGLTDSSFSCDWSFCAPPSSSSWLRRPCSSAGGGTVGCGKEVMEKVGDVDEEAWWEGNVECGAWIDPCWTPAERQRSLWESDRRLQELPKNSPGSISTISTTRQICGGRSATCRTLNVPLGWERWLKIYPYHKSLKCISSSTDADNTKYTEDHHNPHLELLQEPTTTSIFFESISVKNK